METAESHNAPQTGKIELDTMPDKVSRTVPEHVREAIRRTKLEQFDTLARAQEEIERLEVELDEANRRIRELQNKLIIMGAKLTDLI